ncbi:hypothetical protein LTS18_014179 [Coniosporium uncinatum]|uniref:Uncharacterized protein n=1 Tax=Coniosporium uncinatum TaxID=93489 RepID=A0ACC3DD42_9PEZI|nr:hypothetical protein LTS18_014179 [Coniosporium uncinatum]
MKILKRTSHTLESLTVDMRKAISMKVHINNGEPLIYQQEDLNAFSQFHRLRSLGLAVLYGEEEYPNHTCDLLGWNEDEERVQFSSTMEALSECPRLELLHCFNVPQAIEEAGDDPEIDKSLFMPIMTHMASTAIG